MILQGESDERDLLFLEAKWLTANGITVKEKMREHTRRTALRFAFKGFHRQEF